ncbi:MAG: hypothetical protein AAF402_13470 [Pseudomonadota bacterium]
MNKKTKIEAGSPAHKPTRNWVAKHARSFQHAAIQTDRKKQWKNGYRKHRRPAEDFGSDDQAVFSQTV